MFKERIFEIVNESDELVLQKVQFIYYSLLFPPENPFFDFLISCSKCLKLQYSEYEINEKKKILKDIFGIENLAYDNINSGYKNSLTKPFNFNSYYYTFPTLLEKNILKNDNDIFEAFKQYLKYIYSSELIKDIYYLSPEFSDFVYPLEDDEIFDEMFEYTTFVPFYGGILHGYTQKEIPDILIAINLEDLSPKETDLSKIICELSQILNTCMHEQARHYIKSLIFYNSFLFNIKKRINSDLYNYGEETEYIYGILKKNKIKIDKNLSIDGGEKGEIYLYGNILEKIYFPQAFELFKLSNWNKTIVEHIKNFQSINNTYKDMLFIYYKEFDDNKDLSDFIKKFIKEFIKSFNHLQNIENTKVFLNPNDSSCKISEKNINNIDINKIKFECRCYININKIYIHDASW